MILNLLTKFVFMKHIFYILLFLLSSNLSAQFNTYYVGHSLINKQTPWMVKQLRIAAGTTTQYRHHIINGSSLQYQWQHPASFESDLIWNPTLMQDEEHGKNFLDALAPGATPAFKRMVITESIPITNNLNDTTGKYGKNFHDLAKTHDGSIKNFMLQTWEHQLDYGNLDLWRASINTLLPNWEAKVDKINTPSTSNNMFIIPAGIAMGALYDTLKLHSIGSLNQISQLFVDDIHLNADGTYFEACVIYACLFQQSPVGLPAVTLGPYNGNTSINDPTVRTKLQEIAWLIATTYPRSGFPPLAVADLNCFGVEPKNNFENISIDFCLQNSSKLQDIEIQFSIDGEHFHTLKQYYDIKGGKYNYTYHEQNFGNLYFRLQFKDIDNLTYSNVITIYLNDNQIKLYPNPAQNRIWLENIAEYSEYSIYNLLGQSLMIRQKYDGGIDISQLPNGLYFLQVEGSSNLFPFNKE